MDRARNAATTWPHGRYTGEDGTGRVHVELDGAARDVAVVLDGGWRSAVGPDGLAAAVLQAFCAAATARLTAWATAPASERQPPPSRPSASRADRPTSESLSRAWRDLREFQLRLTTLHEVTDTASSPGGPAVVTLAGGQIVGVELDPDWLCTAGDRDAERHIGHALRAALTLIAALPERALEGCSDLAALLAGTSFSPASSSHPAP